MTTSPETPVKRKPGPVTTHSTIGSALGAVIAWVVPIIFGVEMPLEVAGSLSVILVALGAFIGGWIAPPRGGYHD